MELYKELAGTIQARLNCIQNKNQDWIQKHEDKISELIDRLPHGSGLDGDNIINLDKSNGEKIIIETSFHHMDENGMYDGWTEHKLIITASLIFGLHIKIIGRDKNNIKEYLHEIFHYALTTDKKIRN